MDWMALLGEKQTLTLPWVGGRKLWGQSRTWKLAGKLPPEFGWHQFEVDGSRKATWSGESWMDDEVLEARPNVCGVLVGDRLIPDGAAVVPDPKQIVSQTLQVHLVEPGLERFTRARAAQLQGGAWVYFRQEFPLGPEAQVLDAFLERKASVDDVPEVTPALDLAFRFESFRREEAELWRALQEEAAREEAERVAREEAAARRVEAHRRRMVELTGTGGGRRELAGRDFEAAARAALRVSGAELLDHRNARNRGEKVVQFRYQRRRFECVVDARSLRIIDSGICLVDHGTGEKGDTYFTLESLPVVIAQAMREGRLVVFRHVD